MIKAEPSEALKANTVFSLGLDNPTYLLSSLQLANFRRKQMYFQNWISKERKALYFINTIILNLNQNSDKNWMIIANVESNHADIIQLIETISNDGTLEYQIKEDINLGTQK